MIITANKCFKHNVEMEIELTGKTKFLTKLRQIIVFIVGPIFNAAILFGLARFAIEKSNIIKGKGNFK